MITRKEAVKKINDYIENNISKEKVYKWALEFIKTGEFDRMEDILLRDTIITLLGLHDDANDVSGSHPSIEELRTFRDKLKEVEN